MIVIVSWQNHDRRYSIGLETFLKTLGLDVSDEQIKQAARYLLEQNELKEKKETDV